MRYRIGLSDPINWRWIVVVALLLTALPTFADEPISHVEMKGLSDGPDAIGVLILKPGTRELTIDIVLVKVKTMAEARDVLGRSALVDGVILPQDDRLLGKCDNTRDCDDAISDVCMDLYGDDRTTGVCTIQQQPDGSGSCEKQCRDGHIVVIVCRKAPAPSAR